MALVCTKSESPNNCGHRHLTYQEQDEKGQVVKEYTLVVHEDDMRPVLAREKVDAESKADTLSILDPVAAKAVLVTLTRQKVADGVALKDLAGVDVAPGAAEVTP